MAALGLVHVVGRDEDRGAATDQREQALPEIAPALRVDGARRLVEQQQLRVVQRRRGEREPLALSAAQRAGALRQQALEIELGRELGDARVSRRAREAEDPRHEVEVLVHGQVVPQREPLRHVAELGAQLLGIARHLVAEHAHAAGRGSSSPQSMRIVVDLPEPFGPRKP